MHHSSRFIDRHFWVAVCIIFVVLFVPMMFREWLSLRSEGLSNVEWYTSSLTSQLRRDLESRHSLIDTLSQLDNRERFVEFDLHVIQKIGHLGLFKVRIYDSSGTMVYDVEEDLVGRTFPKNSSMKMALDGEVVSRIIDRNEYFEEYGQEINVDMAEVYMPIVSESDGSIPYVLEAYYDYSPITSRTHRFLIKSTLSLLITTLVVLALLIYLYRGRQRLGRKLEALEAILPICMYCKKIHLEKTGEPDQWVEIEAYFARQEDLSFSHGICQDCLQKHHSGSKAAQKIPGDK